MTEKINKHYLKALQGMTQMERLYFSARVKRANPKTTAEFNKVVEEFESHFKVDASAVKIATPKKAKATKSKAEKEQDSGPE